MKEHNFTVERIPLEVDIWKEIESHLKTGLTEVRRVKFTHDADIRMVIILISHSGSLEAERIILEDEKADELLIKLCERFNIPYYHMSALKFELEPSELPVFDVKLYPYVDDENTLNTSKSRFNVSTID